MFRSCIAILLVLITHHAHSLELRGWVIGISDGDTLTVLDDQKHQHKVRLVGIDAPEKRQAFGEASRQNLARLCFQKEGRVIWEKQDRYGRVIGKVFCDRDDVGLNQIQAGLAWWYRQYAREQLSEDRERYARAESEARSAKLGLWKEPDPLPPWEWRRD